MVLLTALLLSLVQEPAPPPLKVLLVSGSLEYESDASLSAFQEHLERHYSAVCTRAFRKTDEEIPGLEAIESCDVVLLFTRRLKIGGADLERVKRVIGGGKPLVAVRTASHAFQTWLELDKEVLGGSYSNHFGKGPDCTLTFTAAGQKHPVLDGVRPFVSKASLYKNPSNAADTETLILGEAAGKREPLAWTRLHNGARIFTTSLGDQGDFKDPNFVRMIAQALFWTAKRPPERKQARGGPLPGTGPLAPSPDRGAEMVAGIDRFLLREIELSAEDRKVRDPRDRRSPEGYAASLEPLRERLRRMAGAQDPRVPFAAPEVLVAVGESPRVAEGRGVDVFAVRWPVVRGVVAEGLLLEPAGREPAGTVVLLPDADQTPEQLAGLDPSGRALAAAFAQTGWRVLVPAVLGRRDDFSVSAIGRASNQPHREFVHRPAFVVGRTLPGYEAQTVMAAVDWIHRAAAGRNPDVAVVGLGEGGFAALLAAALDPRIDAVHVESWFGPRESAWSGPIYRTLFGFLREFGDAGLASLVYPRAFSFATGPALRIDGPPPPRPGRSGAAPGAWASPSREEGAVEAGRLKALLAGLPPPRLSPPMPPETGADLRRLRPGPDPSAREARLLAALLEDTQVLRRRGEQDRQASFWSTLDLKSTEGFEKSVEPHRERFVRDVIGRFDRPLDPPNPRSRPLYEEARYRAYEVALDVWPDVIAAGILLVPKDLKDGERRPVVVCQHGLEGRPEDLADPLKDHPAYERYACKLADRGFVVFAPQNPYLGGDRFRTLQRKANLLGTHLFSIIIPQHEQITAWLASLPFVDPSRIAFYGLSYGGKTAMRVPAAVKRYCLSICSADFNEWVWKNGSLDNPYTYVTTGEYEIFEWNLAATFNYAEMAALIAPRPFMVERGHFDGVAPDEQVAYEYAKVRRLYDRLGLGDRTELEVFDGPHKIHAQGTFAFLHRHLAWPEPR